ncbi:MAG: TIGR01906 family membrane protein [Atribacterota bacterium]|nr:TIGR01906 family membrane protein [Atribacterota bacterium]
MKIIRTILWWFFIITIPILLVTTVVRLEVQFLPFYEYEYEKNSISQITGFDDHQLGIITRHLIQYFNDKIKNPQLIVEKNNKAIQLFNAHEIIHLKDVKEIFQIVFRVQYIALGYFILYMLVNILFKKKEKMFYFWKGLKNGSILTVILLSILGIGLFTGFYQLFIQFHYLVFGDPQSSPWILDPRTDHLVMMYPLNFWQDAALLGVFVILSTSIILIMLSCLVLLSYRSKRKE